MHWMHQGPKHLGAQTRATGTRTPNPEVEESTRSMRPKKTLKQACFQGYPESAVYVQIPVGSRNSASRNAYHTSLRPSSLFEPRHPSLKVVRKQSPCGGYRQREDETTHYIGDNTLCALAKPEHRLAQESLEAMDPGPLRPRAIIDLRKIHLPTRAHKGWFTVRVWKHIV